MTVVACLLAVALVAVVLLFLRSRASVDAQHTSEREQAEKRWADERRELLNRIQSPGVLPFAPAEGFQEPEAEPDEYSLVGVVQDSDKPEGDW